MDIRAGCKTLCVVYVFKNENDYAKFVRPNYSEDALFESKLAYG